MSKQRPIKPKKKKDEFENGNQASVSLTARLYQPNHLRMKPVNPPRPIPWTSKAFQRFLRKVSPEKRRWLIAQRREVSLPPPKRQRGTVSRFRQGVKAIL